MARTRQKGKLTAGNLQIKEEEDVKTTTSKKVRKAVSDTSRKTGQIGTVDGKKESSVGHARKKKKSSTDGRERSKSKRGPEAEVNEGPVCSTPYRSSLGGIMTVVRELNLRDSHKQALKLTPFWAIFQAIIDEKVTQSQCRKSDKMIMEIIESFDPDEGKFRIGKKRQLIDLTSADLVSFFGIQCGKDFVSLQYGCKEAVKFVTRRGIEDKRLTTKGVRQLLNQYVKGEDKDDIEDVVRLLCLYLIHTFFFPMGINVKWVLCERVDDLERMRSYDWNGAIIKELMTSIKKYHKEPKKVSGCVMSLLYWLCEHTTLAQPLHPEHTLGIVRWSIPILVNKFKKVWIKDLKRKQVVLEVTIVGRLSGDDEPEEKHVVDDTLLPVDVERSNDSSARHTEDVIRCTEDMPTPSECGGNVDGYVADSGGHMDRTPVGFEGYKDSPSNDYNASTVKELCGYIEKKDGEIAALKRQLQDKDEMHKRDIEVKDCEIAVLNDKILSLLADEGQLWEECAEHVTHAVTQGIRPVCKDDVAQQRSLVKNVKSKKRKGTEKEEFVYQHPSKRQVVVPGGPDGDVDKAMVDVDAYVPGPKKPASKLDEIKGLQTNKVFRLLSSDDRMKIESIWKEATNSTNIWCGSVTNCSVFAEDIRCLITENAISGNVIDAYAEYLLMEQELKGTDIGKEGNYGGITQGGSNVSVYAFTSSFLSLIAGKSCRERGKTFEHMMTKTSRYRFLLFPVHLHFHWTLLANDTEEGTWKFYNSMKPRKGMMDANLEAARQLKIQIESYYKSKSMGVFCTQECQEIEQVVDSPQQAPGSLDCGVIVCYIIRQHFRNEEVSSKLPKSECRRMRAEIIHCFVSDELHSWNAAQPNNEAEQ